MHHAEITPVQQRRNVVMLGLEMTLFLASLGLIAPNTLVPLFVSRLTDSPQAIGGLMAAFQVGWMASVFIAGEAERRSRKMPLVLLFGVIERVPALALTVCPLLVPFLGAPAVLALVYASRFGQAAAGGLMSTPWLDVVARSVPATQRGRFMGIFTTVGNLLAAGVAALAAPLLDWLPFPYSFAACFGIGALIMGASFLPLLGIVEPPGPPPRESGSLWRQLANLPSILTADRPFRRFVAGMALAALGAMGSGFLVVYGVSRLGASDELAAWYTVSLLIAQVLANVLFGWLADRRDFSAAAQATALSGLGLAVAGLLAPDATWLLLAFVLLGANQAGQLLAKLAGPMDFAPADRRPTYSAVMNAVQGLTSAVGPLVAGQLVASFGYQWLFGACAVLSLAATVALSSGSQAPRHHRPEESV